MRKTMIAKDTRIAALPDYNWLDLLKLAQVELTSEDAAYPVESALQLPHGAGWRAADAGEQTIRLLFDDPLHIRHVRLVFCENKHPRTQEFLLRWSSNHGQSFHEVVRQQYNFSPPDTVCEIEEYEVDLPGLNLLELTLIPDISGGSGRASIAQFRLAA